MEETKPPREVFRAARKRELDHITRTGLDSLLRQSIAEWIMIGKDPVTMLSNCMSFDNLVSLILTKDEIEFYGD